MAVDSFARALAIGKSNAYTKSETDTLLNAKADKATTYTKTETDAKITEKVAEIVADAPEDFDTLKEMSDWISHHEESAAAMNSAIQANTTAITGKVDKETGKGLSTEDYTTSEKTKLSGIANNATDIGRLYPNSTYGEIFNDYTTNKASGTFSHAEGSGCTASGSVSHTEGQGCTASGGWSHAEGYYCVSLGNYSHAEGSNCNASGQRSHAEGHGCTASGGYSHAEGYSCTASGERSHASGERTIATATAQTTIGKNNVADSTGTYAFIIGNGSANNARSNAFAVDWNGLIYVGNSATGVNVTNLVEKEQGKGLSTEDYTTAEKTKLAGLSNYDDSALQTAISNKVDKVTGKGLSTEDYTTAEKTKLAGLSNYDDSALQTAISNKVDKVTGKGLSTEDYTTAEKNRLALLSELDTAAVTIDLNSQTWTESANGLFYTGNISVTNLYRALSAIITGFSALKPTDNVAVIANSDKTAIRLTASTNTFSNQANITVSVFGRFTSS